MTFLTSILALIISVGYTGGYREGDWVTYTDTRFVTSVAMDQTTVYFGTGGGVLRYDRLAERWLDPMTVTDGIPDNRIQSIAYDPDFDRIYVQTPLGAAYYQPTFRQWYAAPQFPENLARNDFRPQSVGLLTTAFGYTYQNGVITDLNFRTYQITRGVDDGFNHLFVGTWGLGPAMINPRYGELKIMSYGLYNENVTALVRQGNTFWAGGGFGDESETGITRFDTALQNWSYFVPRSTTGISSTKISSALTMGKTTWLGTDYGLIRYDSDGDNFTSFADFSPLPSTEVTSLAADSAWIYVGTENGLGYFAAGGESRSRKHKKEAVQDTLSADSAESNVPLSPRNRLLGWHIHNLKILNNFLYIAGDRGVLRRQLNSYSDFQYVNTPDEMLSTDIYDVAAIGDSLLFLSRNDIIVIDTLTGKSSTITDQSYFGQWRMRKFAIADGNIWAATSLGLWKYRLKDGNTRLFTTADGMISSDVRGIEIIDNYIWMATPKGIIRFLSSRSGRMD